LLDEVVLVLESPAFSFWAFNDVVLLILLFDGLFSSLVGFFYSFFRFFYNEGCFRAEFWLLLEFKSADFWGDAYFFTYCFYKFTFCAFNGTLLASLVFWDAPQPI
jgi:hypothetical protein